MLFFNCYRLSGHISVHYVRQVMYSSKLIDNFLGPTENPALNNLNSGLARSTIIELFLFSIHKIILKITIFISLDIKRLHLRCSISISL